jgi:small nuclear ribonucleoprotein (snRNP)-like protein
MKRLIIVLALLSLCGFKSNAKEKGRQVFIEYKDGTTCRAKLHRGEFVNAPIEIKFYDHTMLEGEYIPGDGVYLIDGALYGPRVDLAGTFKITNDEMAFSPKRKNVNWTITIDDLETIGIKLKSGHTVQGRNMHDGHGLFHYVISAPDSTADSVTFSGVLPEAITSVLSVHVNRRKRWIDHDQLLCRVVNKTMDDASKRVYFSNGDIYEGLLKSVAPIIPQSGIYYYHQGGAISGTFSTDFTPLSGKVSYKDGKSGKLWEAITAAKLRELLLEKRWDMGAIAEYNKKEAKRIADEKRREAEQLAAEKRKQEAEKAKAALAAFDAYLSKEVGLFEREPMNSYPFLRSTVQGWGFNYLQCNEGASIKLRNMYKGKRVTLKSKKSTDIGVYLCTDVKLDNEGNSVKIYCERNGKKREFEVHHFDMEDKPEGLKCVKPSEINMRYGKCTVSEHKGPSYVLYLDSSMQAVLSRIRQHYVDKYGPYYGTAILNGKVELGMSLEMVQSIRGKGSVTKRVSSGGEVTTLTYGGYNYSSALGMGSYSSESTYTFINGKLTDYTVGSGQSYVF